MLRWPGMFQSILCGVCSGIGRRMCSTGSCLEEMAHLSLGSGRLLYPWVSNCRRSFLARITMCLSMGAVTERLMSLRCQTVTTAIISVTNPTPIKA